jgi:hypothetical protein
MVSLERFSLSRQGIDVDPDYCKFVTKWHAKVSEAINMLEEIPKRERLDCFDKILNLIKQQGSQIKKNYSSVNKKSLQGDAIRLLELARQKTHLLSPLERKSFIVSIMSTAQSLLINESDAKNKESSPDGAIVFIKNLCVEVGVVARQIQPKIFHQASSRRAPELQPYKEIFGQDLEKEQRDALVESIKKFATGLPDEQRWNVVRNTVMSYKPLETEMDSPPPYSSES